MSMLFDLLAAGIILICVAFARGEGLWGNLVTLFALILSGLLAMNFFEPLADLMETKGGGFVASLTYWLDFLAIWVIFLVTFLLLKLLTRKLSDVKVRFRKPVELAGSILLSAVVGWVLVCFIATTIHLAPLPRTAFGGGFDPNKRMVFGLAPDIKWLAFTFKTTSGALSRGGEQTAFDPQGQFITVYNSRRAALEREEALRVRR